MKINLESMTYLLYVGLSYFLLIWFQWLYCKFSEGFPQAVALKLEKIVNCSFFLSGNCRMLTTGWREQGKGSPGWCMHASDSYRTCVNKMLNSPNWAWCSSWKIQHNKSSGLERVMFNNRWLEKLQGRAWNPGYLCWVDCNLGWKVKT